MPADGSQPADEKLLSSGVDGTGIVSLRASTETADTKPQSDHALSHPTTRHRLRMTVFDPLVLIEPSAQAGLRGWAVAAAIIARLQEVGLSDGIDVPAILGPAISDLSEPELEQLARQLFGPLMDISRCLLGHHVREWLAACQVRPE